MQIAHKILLCDIINHGNILRSYCYFPTAPHDTPDCLLCHCPYQLQQQFYTDCHLT